MVNTRLGIVLIGCFETRAHSKTIGGLPLASDVFLFQYVSHPRILVEYF